MADTPAFNSALMDEDQLKEWILRQLGAPLIKVEITKEQLEDCVEMGKRWFSAKKGLPRSTAFQVLDGLNEYDLPDDVDKVFDVVFSTNPLDLSLVFSPYLMQDEKVPYDVFAAPRAAGVYSSLAQTIQYIETVKRILGADLDWRQEGRKLYIFPIPKNATSIRIEYKAKTFDAVELEERDHDLLKRYALAMAKKIVGRIRSKYDSFPTAQGTASLDGQALLDEASIEVDKLEEEISDSAGPMGFISG